jgi:hypothetical protein
MGPRVALCESAQGARYAPEDVYEESRRGQRLCQPICETSGPRSSTSESPSNRYGRSTNPPKLSRRANSGMNREISVWGWRLIIVWLGVRVLPAPPHNPIQTEIFRCRANRAVPAGFLCGPFVSADGRPNVTAFFAAVVSAPQNRVSRKRRPTVAETSSNGRQLNVPLLRSKYFSDCCPL